MKKIVITGAGGLLGTHMQILLSTREDIEVVALNREAFGDKAALHAALKNSDVIFHFAGVNRATDEEISSGNPGLATALIDALAECGETPWVLYSSSIQQDQDNVYGRSKKAAADLLSAWAREREATFTNLVLPHIFGEGGRPNYNSVISTFCSKVAQGETPTIAHDGEIEPIHAQRLCGEILDLVDQDSRSESELRIHGNRMRVSEMLSRLTVMAENYRGNIFPDLRDTFDLDLFNTYRSYLYPDYYPHALTKHADDRGWLVESVKELNGGQVFFSTTKPGITRGNHFHLHKVERFLVVSGKAEICVRKIGSEQVDTFSVDGDTPAFVDIPTLHTHNITNTGDGELLTLFWVHEIFDPENTDTYFVDV